MNSEKNPFISIIIPVYNVEPYIERCFRSVVTQTYQNYEVIFVDDCGTDRSVKILQNLISDYKNKLPLKLIHHEKNRGLSAARNSGIKESKGEYLYFADSDDELFSETLSLLVQPVMQTKYDFVVGRSKITMGEEVFLSKLPSQKSNSSALNAFFDCQSCRLGASACNRLYRKNFLIEQNIFFQEGVLWEDALFNIEICCCTEKFLYIEEVTYNYIIRQGSIITSLTPKHFEDELKTVELLEIFMKEKELLDRVDALRLLIFRKLRLLIISWNYGDLEWKQAFAYIRSKTGNMKEFKSLYFKHKLLYLQYFMPKPLAYVYTRIFVWLYRTLIWKG